MKQPILSICCLLLSVFPAFAAELTTCGQTVFDAELVADLDCSATPGFAVVIESGGSLKLSGHTLTTGSPSNDGDFGGVRCLGICTIDGGGGTLVSGFPHAMNGYLSLGVGSLDGRGHASISGVTILGYYYATSSKTLEIDSCILSDHWIGMIAKNLTVSNSTISSFYSPMGGYVIGARRVVIADSTFDGGSSIYARRLEMFRSSVTGMQYDGIDVSAKVYAEDSSIDGNCLTTLTLPCADIVTHSGRAPSLVNTTCSTSLRVSSAGESRGSWGVCALD